MNINYLILIDHNKIVDVCKKTKIKKYIFNIQRLKIMIFRQMKGPQNKFTHKRILICATILNGRP